MSLPQSSCSSTVSARLGGTRPCHQVSSARLVSAAQCSVDGLKPREGAKVDSAVPRGLGLGGKR